MSSATANWTYTYKREDIIPDGVISERKPGKAIAEAINEIQEKTVIGIGTVNLSGISGGFSVSGNKLNVNLSAAPGVEAAEEKTIQGDGVTIEMTEDSQSKTFAVIGNGEAEAYQVFQKKADGTFGFDFVRFHD